MKNTSDERKLMAEAEKQLKRYFTFYSEVKGTHFTTKRLRIDHVIVAKQTTLRHGKQVAFGVEYKSLTRSGVGTNFYTSWLAQCVDYAHTVWDGFGFLPILQCTGIATEMADMQFQFWGGLLGQLGVGQLRNNENIWSILFQDERGLAYEKNGINLEKTFSECELMNGVEKRLAKYFTFYRDVGGTHCSGKRMRIDYIIVPRHLAEWKGERVAFGVAFKNFSRKEVSTRFLTDWLAKCVDYAHTDWDDFGYVYILQCPSWVEKPGDRQFSFLDRLLGQLGVGHLRNNHNGWSIILQGDRNIWCERYGIKHGANWVVKRKFGNRGR